MRVVVIEDHKDTAELMNEILRDAGHDVRVAHSGHDGVTAALALPAEVVLCDVGLPDIDGYEVARRLRADGLGRDPLIVATTGYGRSQDREKSARAGIDAHLTKPIDMEHLAQLLARGRRVPKG